jgi:glycosyltransferase involved in cell wall biosynthesis
MDKIISVVIPTFDRKALTDRAIESVAPSQPNLFEIIVVDDCGTVPYAFEEGVNSHGVPVRTFRTSTNVGPGLARKLAVEKATGSVISFLDSDDVFDRGWPDAILSEVLRRETPLQNGLFIAGRSLGGRSQVTEWVAGFLESSPDSLKEIYTRLTLVAFNPFYTPATAISKQLCEFSDLGRYSEDYFTNAMAVFKARKISILPVTACTLSRPPGALGGLSELQRKMWQGEFGVRKNILRNRSIPLQYRVLVPLGMAYAVARNVLKSALRKLRTPATPAPRLL